MKTNRFLPLAAALTLAATVFSGCGAPDWVTGNRYPSRAEMEQSVRDTARFARADNPTGAATVRITSLACVDDTGVKEGTRYRCDVSTSDGVAFGAEVVVDDSRDWVLTPGWFDSDRNEDRGRYVATGHVPD